MQLDSRPAAGLAAALLFEDPKFREPLRAALTAAGAAAIEELRFSELNLDQLSDLDSSVLIVNLESVIVGRSATLAEILDRFKGRIVFNDAEATAALADSDRPRWIRHLASKIGEDCGTLPPRPNHQPTPLSAAPATRKQDFDIWFLVASIGGPEALRVFLAELASGPPVALVLVQHIGPEFVAQMIKQLQQVSALPVSLARDGEALEPGRVFVVPPDKQTQITPQRLFKLESLPENSRFSPCIDQVLGDAVDRLGAGANAIVFSGMANDGVEAATRLIDCNGEVWVQSPESCVVSSIVDGIMKHGGEKYMGTPAQLAIQFNQRIDETNQE